MKFDEYKILFARPTHVQTVGNIEGISLTRNFKDTNIRVKGRNDSEAMKKARRWFSDTGIKVGSITVEKIKK